MEKRVIIWTLQAKASLKSIYDYYKGKTPQGAVNVKNDLLQSPKTIAFSKQYQVDDINPKYRRTCSAAFAMLRNILKIN